MATREPTTTSVRQFLHERTVGEVIFEKSAVIEVPASTTIDKALEVMAEHNIRAVPVYTQKVHECGEKIYHGIVSTFDIVSLIAFSTVEGDEGFRSDVDLQNTPLSDVIGQLSEEGKRVWLFEGPEEAYHLCEAFGKGVHRALVHQKDDFTGQKAFRLVTQTDLLRFFIRREDLLKPQEPVVGLSGLPTKKLWNKTLEELGFCNPLGEVRKILELTATDTAMQGFREMALTSIQALPIVDDQRRVLTTLSVSDMRGITSKTMKEALYSPVLDYLRSVYGNMLHPITCKPRDTLWDVMVKLSAAKIQKHQAWITDPDEKILGVVSLSDILQKVYYADS